MANDSELLSLSDIARLAGVGRTVVGNWRDRYEDFPKPAAKPTAGPVFRREEVAVWLQGHRPQAGKIQPLGFEAQLWKAADALRNNMDAGEYKHVVLGLIFLKYISDAFEERHGWLLGQAADPGSDYYIREERARYQVAEDRDEYLAEHIFWVPQEARWSYLQANARQPTI